MTAEQGDYIKVTYGKHKGKIVQVVKSGKARVTFRESVYNRYVNHGHYDIINDTPSTDGTINADDDNSHNGTNRSNDYVVFHIAGIANIVASQSNGVNDVDKVLDEITRKIRNMAIKRVRSRS